MDESQQAWEDFLGDVPTPTLGPDRAAQVGRVAALARSCAADLLAGLGRPEDAGRVAVDPDGLEQALVDEKTAALAAGTPVARQLFAARHLLLSAHHLDEVGAGQQGPGQGDAHAADVANLLRIATSSGPCPPRVTLARDYAAGAGPQEVLAALSRAADAADRLA